MLRSSVTSLSYTFFSVSLCPFSASLFKDATTMLPLMIILAKPKDAFCSPTLQIQLFFLTCVGALFLKFKFR